jgi:ABC-2 type transport system permease protein
VLILPLLATALLIALAGWIAMRRDLGTGVIATHESRAPRLRLLSSPGAHALRSERSSLAVWLGSIGAFALILGVVSSGVSGAGISKSIEREIAKFGAGSVLTPKGYLSLIFIFFVLAVSLFACAQVGAARQEEARNGWRQCSRCRSAATAGSAAGCCWQ